MAPHSGRATAARTRLTNALRRALQRSRSSTRAIGNDWDVADALEAVQSVLDNPPTEPSDTHGRHSAHDEGADPNG